MRASPAIPQSPSVNHVKGFPLLPWGEVTRSLRQPEGRWELPQLISLGGLSPPRLAVVKQAACKHHFLRNWRNLPPLFQTPGHILSCWPLPLQGSFMPRAGKHHIPWTEKTWAQHSLTPLKLMFLQPGSGSKGTCCRVWWHELIPRSHKVEGEN